MLKYLFGAGLIACSALAGGPVLASGGVSQWLCLAGTQVAGMAVIGVDSYAFLSARTETVTPVEYDRDGQVELRGALSQRAMPGGAAIVLSNGPLVTKYGLTSGYLNNDVTRPSLVFGGGAGGSLQCQPD